MVITSINARFLHANSKYRRDGDIDPNALTQITDVTDKVKKILGKTEADAIKAVSIVNSDRIPDIDPLLATSDAFADWLEIRKELEPKLPNNSIYNLPKIGHRVAKNLIVQNVRTIAEIQKKLCSFVPWHSKVLEGAFERWSVHQYGRTKALFGFN